MPSEQTRDEPAWTKGPWSVSTIVPTLVVADAGEDPDHPGEGLVVNVAITHIAHGCIVTQEEKANATLIAASPCMYDALADARTALEHAASTFYRYAKLHRAKGTDEGDKKACANASHGEEMRAAISTIDDVQARARGTV